MDPVGWVEDAVVAGAVAVLLASAAGVVAVVAPGFVPNNPDAAVAVADTGVAVVVDVGAVEAAVPDGPVPNRPPPAAGVVVDGVAGLSAGLEPNNEEAGAVVVDGVVAEPVVAVVVAGAVVPNNEPG